MSIYWNLELVTREVMPEFNKVYDRKIADFNLDNSSFLRMWVILGVEFDKDDDKDYPHCGSIEISVNQCVLWLTKMDQHVKTRFNGTTMYELVSNFVEAMANDKIVCKVSWG